MMDIGKDSLASNVIQVWEAISKIKNEKWFYLLNIHS